MAERLSHYKNTPGGLVLALPRGGVVVGYEIAKALSLPLDVLVVRKLGAPYQPELAMGAIASGGIEILDDDTIADLGITQDEIAAEIAVERLELERREKRYRENQPPLEVAGKTVLLVDDGIATGSTMSAALAALRKQQPKRLVVAVAVGPTSTMERLRGEADEVVCLMTPYPFQAISLWYEDFPQTSDEEVRNLLSEVC